MRRWGRRWRWGKVAGGRGQDGCPKFVRENIAGRPGAARWEGRGEARFQGRARRRAARTTALNRRPHPVLFNRCTAGENFFCPLRALCSLLLQSTLLAPPDGLAATCADFRHCPSLSDDPRLTLGATRGLHDPPSGRGFRQHGGPLLPDCPEIAHFFTTSKAPAA